MMSMIEKDLVEVVMASGMESDARWVRRRRSKPDSDEVITLSGFVQLCGWHR